MYGLYDGNGLGHGPGNGEEQSNLKMHFQSTKLCQDSEGRMLFLLLERPDESKYKISNLLIVHRACLVIRRGCE